MPHLSCSCRQGSWQWWGCRKCRVDPAPARRACRDALHWQPCVVTSESGRELPAQFAALMEHDPCADATYIMHWRLGKLLCTFKVRIRRGWERLRDYLVRVSGVRRVLRGGVGLRGCGQQGGAGLRYWQGGGRAAQPR